MKFNIHLVRYLPTCEIQASVRRIMKENIQLLRLGHCFRVCLPDICTYLTISAIEELLLTLITLIEASLICRNQ